MNHKNEFSKWMRTIENAISGELPLDHAADDHQSNSCGCDDYNCRVCFPDDSIEEPMHCPDGSTSGLDFNGDLQAKVPLMGEEDMLDEEEPNKPRPTPKPIDQDEDDPYSAFNMGDILGGPTDNLPASRADSTDKEIPGEQQPMNLPTSSAGNTRAKTQNMTASDEMRRMMNMINPAAGGDEPEIVPEPTQDALTVRSASDIPAVMSSALEMSGVRPPEWHTIRNLPGFTEQMIRGMGRTVFGMMTSTPLENIKTIANVDGQGPNTSGEVRGVAQWLLNNAEDMGPVEVNHGAAIPGYQPEAREYVANGIRFHVVRDPMGEYIYTWPESTTKSGRTQQSITNNQQRGPGNMARLRESVAPSLRLSLFEQLAFDEETRRISKTIFESSVVEDVLDESNLSREIAWYPGPPGKQKKRQGGWNLLNLLHKKFRMSDDASMERLPFNRNVLYNYFKNHPDHFIIVQGTDGVAAIRPSEAYHKHRKGIDSDWASDPNKDVNDPFLQYEVIAFKNDGLELAPELFQDPEAVAKAKEKEAARIAKGKDPDKNEFTTTDPTVRRLRMGKFHNPNTKEPYNIFRLLSEEIGTLTAMWLSGFYALRKGEENGEEPEIRPHTGAIDREKIATRADRKKPVMLGRDDAMANAVNRLQPVIKHAVDMASGKIDAAYKNAAASGNDSEVERLLPKRKQIAAIKTALDTDRTIRPSGEFGRIVADAIAAAFGTTPHSKEFLGYINDIGQPKGTFSPGRAQQMRGISTNIYNSLMGSGMSRAPTELKKKVATPINPDDEIDF